MTEPENPTAAISDNVMITFDLWNKVVASTRFPAYKYDQTSYKNGGNLDAYRRTWSGYTLGSIDSYGSRYTQYRDIRSTYMYRSYASVDVPSNNVWATLTNCTLSNTYNSTNQEGRLSLDKTTGQITPNINSAYVFWAEIRCSDVPQSFTNAFLQIRADGSTIADINQNIDLNNNTSFRLRNQTIVAYKNTSYTVRFKLLYTGSPPSVSVSFGYAELIGQKSGCGAYSVL